MPKPAKATPLKPKHTNKKLSIPPTPFLKCLGVGTGMLHSFFKRKLFGNHFRTISLDKIINIYKPNY